MWPRKVRQTQNEDDQKHEDNLQNEEDLKKDDFKNKQDHMKEDDLKYQKSHKNKDDIWKDCLLAELLTIQSYHCSI